MDYGLAAELDEGSRRSHFHLLRAHSLAQGGEPTRATQLDQLLDPPGTDESLHIEAASAHAICAAQERDPSRAGRHAAWAVELLGHRPRFQ